MTIKELKKLISKLPDDMKVMSHGGDHDYKALFDADTVTAEYIEDDNYYGEWYQGCSGKKVKIFVVGAY